MTFFPLRADDVDRVLDYMAHLFTAVGYDRERQRAGLNQLLADPQLGGTWVIHVDGQPAGYLVLTACFSLEFHGTYGLVDELFVIGRWRGQGIGTRALAFAEEWARGRGYRALRLEVVHWNPGAFRLYRRYGFEAPDRHLLTKSLDSPAA